MMIKFDDVGSYPLPINISKNWMTDAIKIRDNTSFSIIQDSMRQKIGAGVEIPTYPQFQDMNAQFLEIINDDTNAEREKEEYIPFLIRKDSARIIELEALEDIGEEYYEKNEERLNIKICVTGPIELYLKQYGTTSYKDILEIFAANVDSFISNSIYNAKNFNISTVSIDEPSIGINSRIMFRDDDIIDVLEIASTAASDHDIDTEIHLHSPLHYKLICQTSSIDIISIESAANPSYLDLIDKNDLEDYDKFLRVGIARTDIFNMATVLNEKYGTNVWKDPSKLEDIVTSVETPEVIEKRLEIFHRYFKDRIKYAGPDCGLGAWPTQKLAFHLLNNAGIGIKRFSSKNETY